mmetsp:Transcript_104975/g.282123  ORF Transcript_104975/g.282123 Transcript_104975/m.282123 type:complete len:281 (+) Transcript_104975:1-843(+)
MGGLEKRLERQLSLGVDSLDVARAPAVGQHRRDLSVLGAEEGEEVGGPAELGEVGSEVVHDAGAVALADEVVEPWAGHLHLGHDHLLAEAGVRLVLVPRDEEALVQLLVEELHHLLHNLSGDDVRGGRDAVAERDVDALLEVAAVRRAASGDLVRGQHGQPARGGPRPVAPGVHVPLHLGPAVHADVQPRVPVVAREFPGRFPDEAELAVPDAGERDGVHVERVRVLRDVRAQLSLVRPARLHVLDVHNLTAPQQRVVLVPGEPHVLYPELVAVDGKVYV